MSNFRHNNKAEKVENTMCRKAGKAFKSWIHIFSVMLFCMVLSIGTVVFADEVPATVIVAGAKIRATADTSSEALAGVKSGDTLSICGQTTGADGNIWYQVYVNSETKGFIRSDLVQKKTDGTIATVPNENANTTTTANTTNTTVDTSETQVTAVEQKTGTVVTSNVRIRKGASTQHDVVATANKGMVLTVNGEATAPDGKKWYQVSFSYNNKQITGFIRADLVTFDSVSPDTAVSEITGTEETPEEIPTEVSTEPVEEEQPQEQASEPQDENANIILMNVDQQVYVLPEFTPIILKWEDQDINAYKNGKFYLFYAQKQNGETGWFLYDSENGIYQRYVYDTADAVIPDGKAGAGNLFPIIILVVVIVILLVIIALMFLKLREYTSDYYDEYDDDDDGEENYDEDDEELEEEELEEEEEPVQQPVRRPERPQPQRRPERSQQPESGQAPRRQPQPGNGQAPRRQPQPENAQTPRRQPQPENGQVPRRQPQPENGQAPRRQPHPENGQAPRRQPGEGPARRPAPQQNRPNKGNQNQQLQNGRRAKNFLEAEDDDMEFIDI